MVIFKGCIYFANGLSILISRILISRMTKMHGPYLSKVFQDFIFYLLVKFLKTINPLKISTYMVISLFTSGYCTSLNLDYLGLGTSVKGATDSKTMSALLLDEASRKGGHSLQLFLMISDHWCGALSVLRQCPLIIKGLPSITFCVIVGHCSLVFSATQNSCPSFNSSLKVYANVQLALTLLSHCESCLLMGLLWTIPVKA